MSFTFFPTFQTRNKNTVQFTMTVMLNIIIKTVFLMNTMQ